MEQEKIQLTELGYKNFAEELEHLIQVERPDNIEQIKAARGQGDLSENADYDAARNRQAIIEARIQEIEHVFDNFVVVLPQEKYDQYSLEVKKLKEEVGLDAIFDKEMINDSKKRVIFIERLLTNSKITIGEKNYSALLKAFNALKSKADKSNPSADAEAYKELLNEVSIMKNYIEKCANIVKEKAQPTISIGCKVCIIKIEDEPEDKSYMTDSKELEKLAEEKGRFYSIVSTIEEKNAENISNLSPMGQSLIGKKLFEIIQPVLPNGRNPKFKIIKIIQ
ncbi:MAG: GreA/GreB family elongation factor [Bacilli bacterium]